MSHFQNEINDDEIRIISASEPSKRPKRKHVVPLFLQIIIAVILLATIILSVVNSRLGKDETDEVVDISTLSVGETGSEILLKNEPEPIIIKEEEPVVKNEEPVALKGYTIARDTMIGRNTLLILTPEIAHPQLVVGLEALNDSSIILATQAADVRGDNGQILGTFILNGELVSKGESKAGFCSIINGELTIGIADTTPMFEQALVDGGFFFRQYPLVVGGQVVENKPKGKSIRKALAEIDGKIHVIISKDKLTFHDFSQLLADAGVRNAIYLVGSSSYGFYINDAGDKIWIGNVPASKFENVNFIVWK